MTLHVAAPAALPVLAMAGGLAEGSEVLTLSGIRPVEALQPGDRVVTRGGARVLRGIESRSVARARLVRVCASALGHDRPEADILLAADQQILVRDWRAKAMTGQDRALIVAGKLVDGEYIRAEARAEVRLYTLRFDGPAVIYAQGLELACAEIVTPG